jgi:hypothetical protein
MQTPTNQPLIPGSPKTEVPQESTTPSCGTEKAPERSSPPDETTVRKNSGAAESWDASGSQKITPDRRRAAMT